MVIFWFRRDLRLSDSKALSEACKRNEKIIPIFIFDDHILSKLENKNDRRISFLIDVLISLNKALKEYGSRLHVFKGNPEEIFESIFKNMPVSAVYANEDYEPYALKRDGLIANRCEKTGVDFRLFKDHVIFRPDEVMKSDGTPYKVFTPYKNEWLKKFSQHERSKLKVKYELFAKTKFDTEIKLSTDEIGFEKCSHGLVSDHKKVNQMVNAYKKKLSSYHMTRDKIALKNGTSGLSPYIRFGLISFESLVYTAKKEIDKHPGGCKGSETWLSELIWREFYQMIMWNFPHVIRKSFRPEYSNVVWSNSRKLFNSWKEGTTGYPIIDAAMRCFRETGAMHNRLRMIVASFLVKDLFIDWKWGEQYFAQSLLDFELASNNGGWQWSASTGCDAQPYFRVFNPASQSKKFDPDGDFILKFVPELKGLPLKFIHEPHLMKESEQHQFGTVLGKDYPLPVVDHAKARVEFIDVFKAARDRYQTERK